MKKTLYDLLEVSSQASQETIQASFQRLIANLNLDAPENSGNQDLANRFILLKDAYTTLSNPHRRAAYDKNLEAKESIANAVEIEPFWNGQRILMAIAFLTMAVGFVSWRQVEAEKIKAEEERIRAEQHIAEVQANQESEAARLEREKINAQSRQDAEFERARRETDWRQRQNEYAELATQRQAQYQKQSEERKRQMEEREEERRARQQKYEDERRLRQLEYEQQRTPNRVLTLPK